MKEGSRTFGSDSALNLPNPPIRPSATSSQGEEREATNKSYERSDWRSHREAYCVRISVVRD